MDGAPTAVNALTWREITMITITKVGNGNDEVCFRIFEWLQIELITMMYGFRKSGKDITTFDKENSKHFCAALQEGLSEIRNELLPPPSPGAPICPRVYMTTATKGNQVDLINEFLDFCGGEPFRINVEN
jgi:hypothetical protein